MIDPAGRHAVHAFITPKTTLHVIGTEFSPRLPYLNECDADFEHPFRPILNTLYGGPHWFTDGKLAIPETERTRAEEFRRLVVEALSAHYSSQRDFTERRALDLRITLEKCEYFQGTSRDMGRSFFPTLFSDFHNAPIPAGRSEADVIANVFKTFNHEYISDYKNGKWISRGDSISEWLYRTVDEEEDFSLVWLGPISGSKEEKLPELYSIILNTDFS